MKGTDVKMKIYAVIKELVGYAIERELIKEADSAYATSRLLELLSLSDYDAPQDEGEIRPLSEILSDICAYVLNLLH